MTEIEKFNNEKQCNIQKQEDLKYLGINFLNNIAQTKYSYNFTWLGRPIIQFPQDTIALQEIIWEIKPDLIIETGIAHGGSLIFSASMLALLEVCGEINNGKVIGIDIDIRTHNRKEIESHPLSKKIEMIEGSSIDKKIIKQVIELSKNAKKILVCLDSNHTHEHVLSELKAYAPLVTIGSYCCVFDTAIENMPEGSFPDRPWDIGNNPKTAVLEFLKNNDSFEIDKTIENKLLITVAPDGYLKRVR
ncbi:cephalosporin hydroxylase family protein [Arcobacter sp.]|uniref:cephalosporin hydroxylase family protein n=1 Tax=Arcobacter sp. TaxID=1872629 RepID=UPI003D0EC43B